MFIKIGTKGINLLLPTDLTQIREVLMERADRLSQIVTGYSLDLDDCDHSTPHAATNQMFHMLSGLMSKVAPHELLNADILFLRSTDDYLLDVGTQETAYKAFRQYYDSNKESVHEWAASYGVIHAAMYEYDKMSASYAFVMQFASIFETKCLLGKTRTDEEIALNEVSKQLRAHFA